MPSVDETLAAHTATLLKHPAVAGVTPGRSPDGREAIVLYLLELTPEAIAELPGTLDGHPVILRTLDQLPRC